MYSVKFMDDRFFHLNIWQQVAIGNTIALLFIKSILLTTLKYRNDVFQAIQQCEHVLYFLQVCLNRK